MSKIGVFGGTFNPPHKGHHLLAKQAVSKLSLDKLIVIPSCISPHKETDKNVTPKQRIEMCKIAFSDIEKCEISDTEIERGGISYTSDTISQLKREHLEDELFLLMGDDMFLTFDSWHKPEIIAATATLAVFLRDKSKGNDVLNYAIQLKLKYNAKITFVRNIVYDVSSTEIRSDFDANVSRLQAPVAQFIVENDMYNNPYTAIFKKVRKYIDDNISEHRKKHIYGTYQEALKLADRYNVNVIHAALAALLHDTTKELDAQRQLDIIKKYNAETFDNELSTAKLLHQVTGAVYAKEIFGVQNDDIINAVRYHTTGRPEMSVLEKIIFIADFIEPTRDYEGVEEIRKYAYQDLDTACIVALDFTIRTLKNEDKIINAQTIEAFRYYYYGSNI